MGTVTVIGTGRGWGWGRTRLDVCLVQKLDLTGLPVALEVAPVVEGDNCGTSELGDYDYGICGGGVLAEGVCNQDGGVEWQGSGR